MCFIVTVASITSRDAKISTFFNTVVQQGKLDSWPGIPFSIPKQKPYIQYKIVREKFPALMAADSIVGSADVFKILNFLFNLKIPMPADRHCLANCSASADCVHALCYC